MLFVRVLDIKSISIKMFSQINEFVIIRVQCNATQHNNAPGPSILIMTLYSLMESIIIA